MTIPPVRIAKLPNELHGHPDSCPRPKNCKTNFTSTGSKMWPNLGRAVGMAPGIGDRLGTWEVFQPTMYLNMGESWAWAQSDELSPGVLSCTG
jgi:hypothetical protein